MKKFLLLAAVTCASSGHAAPKVVTSPNVREFTERFLQNSLALHRSGMIGGARASNPQSSRDGHPLTAAESEIPAGAAWTRHGTLPEFMVKRAMDGRMETYFRKSAAKLNLSRQNWDGFGGKWEFSGEEDSSFVTQPWPASTLSPEKLAAQAEEHLDVLFPEARFLLEFSNTETEYWDGHVKSVTLRFRRIFNGGIILGNSSFLEITFDAHSRISRLSVKWPEFETSERANSTLDPAEAIAYSDDLIKGITSLTDAAASIACDTVKVKGAALGWMERYEGGRPILTPVLSFGLALIGKDARELPFINVPLLKKLHE